MPERRYRVLAVATHPVQYMTPIFRRMATHPALDFHVAYCTLRGAETAHDPEFGSNIQWDVPVLDGHSWTQIQNRGSGAESFFGLFNPGLWRHIRNGNYDAVLCFVGYMRASFWITLLASKLAKSAFLFGTDATALSPRNGSAWKARLKRVLWPRLFRLADQVIVPSTGSRELIVSLGIPEDRVTLTPYSVDNDWWMQQAAQTDRNAVRNSWGAKQDTFVVLFCAKLQPWKRPADLLRAFANANIPDALLIFAGEGPLRSQLESEAASLGVAPRVRFLGFVNQSRLPAVYASCDLMVLPSEYEPFAVVVNEAMCCGCPVIASDRVGAARDLIVPVAPDLVFSCGDVDSLANLLRKAAADAGRLKELGRAAMAHIRTWSPERNIAATVEAIRIAVNRSGRRPPVELGDPAASQSAIAPAAKFRE